MKKQRKKAKAKTVVRWTVRGPHAFPGHETREIAEKEDGWLLRDFKDERLWRVTYREVAPRKSKANRVKK